MRTKLALIGGAMVLVLIWVMAQPVPVVRKLRDLSDAKPAVPPGNGDALVYNSTLGLWTNGVPTGAAGSNVLANSFTTNNPGQLPSVIPFNTNPLTPLMTRINDGTNVDALVTAGSAFTTTRTNTTFLGPISLSAQTNLLTMASGAILLDGAPISSTAGNPINNFYSTNNFFISGKGNTLIVTQTVTVSGQYVYPLVAGANITFTTNNIGTGQTNMTIAASAGGGTPGFDIQSNYRISANQTNIDNGAAGTNAFMIIGGSGNAVTNGNNLLTAYAWAKAATPHASALAANNHFSILLLPGTYDLGTNVLTLDTAYIDVMGISRNTGQMKYVAAWTDRGDTIITSSGDVVKVTVSPNNLTIANVCLETTGASSFAFRSTVDLGVDFRLINVLIRASSLSVGKEPMSYSGIDYGGYYEDVRCWYENSFSGTDANKAASGTFIRCKAGPYSFGAIASGIFIECEADGCSYGRTTCSGTFYRCRGATINGTSCALFGDNGTMSGIMYDCDTSVFGQGIGTGGGGITGTIYNCSATSFGTLSSTAVMLGGISTSTLGIKDSYPSTCLTNTFVGGTIQTTNGIASVDATAAVNIAATGWTNTFSRNAVVYYDGTAVTATVYNNAGTAVYTNATALSGGSILLQKGGKVILSGTGVTGRATVF